jgi:hypothetical protein
MEDLNVIDLAFLHGYDNPTIGLICKVYFSLILFFFIDQIEHQQ